MTRTSTKTKLATIPGGPSRLFSFYNDREHDSRNGTCLPQSFLNIRLVDHFSPHDNPDFRSHAAAPLGGPASARLSRDSRLVSRQGLAGTLFLHQTPIVGTLVFVLFTPSPWSSVCFPVSFYIILLCQCLFSALLVGRIVGSGCYTPWQNTGYPVKPHPTFPLRLLLFFY